MMGVYNPLAKMPRACGECEDRFKCQYSDMTIPRRSDDCPLVEEPNLVINPEEVAEGRVIEIGEDIIVMHHKDYYDLLCEQFKVEPCEDAISREAAIDALIETPREELEWDSGQATLRELPSVAPSRPKGEWIIREVEFGNYKYQCKECGWYEKHAYNDVKPFNFCPNCGADMSKESE